MKRTTCLPIVAFIGLSLFATISCRKIGIEPHPHNPGDTSYSINLTYLNTDTFFGVTNFELIISEPGGRVLLDSIYLPNTPIMATLHTANSVLDVSTIGYSSTFDFYQLDVYKSVQPWKWTAFLGQSLPVTVPTAVPATVTYTNAPFVDINTVHFGSLNNTGTVQPSASYSTASQLNISYSGIAGNDIAYLILPTLGKYSYRPITGTDNTIDLTQMDTTYKVHYNMPSQYTLTASFMYGYYDSTDLSNKYITLFNYFDRIPLGDLQFPPQGLTPIQQYWWIAQASTPDNEFLSYRTFGNPPPASVTLPYPVTPIYTVNSTANDSFSVSFSQRPTSYITNWVAGNINVSIYAPSDSTQLHPLSFIQSLNSKKLQGKSLSALAIQSFAYDMIPGLDYSSYFLRECDPVQVTKHPYFASELQYYKFF